MPSELHTAPLGLSLLIDIEFGSLNGICHCHNLRREGQSSSTEQKAWFMWKCSNYKRKTGKESWMDITPTQKLFLETGRNNALSWPWCLCMQAALCCCFALELCFIFWRLPQKEPRRLSREYNLFQLYTVRTVTNVLLYKDCLSIICMRTSPSVCFVWDKRHRSLLCNTQS